ncbi:hypothetical protein [Longispora albida]|uniref:hypothetical protein n=1 Tax=Longispora albida TaxID=203523 RepID=UPI000372AEC8|nr:hypothetical protein [Longispora albida]
MTERHTLSIVDWHDDGTSVSALWTITPEERAQVEHLLSRHCDVGGLITPDQARQAREITSTWLSYSTTD